MNKITIELCAEDRARLDRLVAALERREEQMPDPDQLEIDDVQQRIADTLAKAEASVNEEPPAPEEPAVTEADVRKLARTLIEVGKKPQLKEIINKYAPSITDIPEDALASVYKQLKALAEA